MGEKMSKSYGNTLPVFEEPKALEKQIMRIVTDSRLPEQPKPPEGDHLFELFSLFATDEQREALAATYRRGGFGYGDVKKSLAEMAIEHFARARQRREELVAHPERVREILGDGAATARRKAAEVLFRAERPAGCGVRCASGVPRRAAPARAPGKPPGPSCFIAAQARQRMLSLACVSGFDHLHPCAV